MITTIQVLTNEVFTLTETCAALEKACGNKVEERCSTPIDQHDCKPDEHMEGRDKTGSKSLICSDQRGGTRRINVDQ